MRLHRSYRLGLVALLCTSLLFASSASPSAASADCIFFPETSKSVCGRFLEYWQQHGGLTQQGLPLTDPFSEVNSTNGRVYLTQYFERARFEYHPENQPPYDVLLGLIGREQLLAKYPNGQPAGQVPLPPHFDECSIHRETGKEVCGAFLAYWLANGGLAQHGLPLTNQFPETNPTDGKSYWVQYFERARFEYHAENKGTPFEVLLGLLGREQFLAKYSGNSPRFRDPLTNASSGWAQADLPEVSAGYAPGGYRIRVTAPLLDFRTVAPLPGYTDARIEVDAARIGGPDNNAFGIVCRVQDHENYYRFEIRSTGQYSIAERVGGVRTYIVPPGPTSTAIRTGGATNHIRADCVENRLSLYANGQLLLEVTDNTHSFGGHGIWAGTPELAGTDIVFTNFTVYAP